MKHVGLFFLFCGLLGSTVWAQSVNANERMVVVRYVALACNSSQPFTRKAKPEVILGTFDSFHATVLNDNPRLVLWQASGVDKEEEMETLLQKRGTFSLPVVIVGARTTIQTVQTIPAEPMHTQTISSEQEVPDSPTQPDYSCKQTGETLQAHGAQQR